ncbi:MAG: serine/threonine protein kinase [Butyrivibrio sp.]|nr:serine/threonine protein kinase [Butyrivibrio sp.]
MNVNNLCLNCMREKGNADGSCEWCGFDEAASPQEPSHLPYGTVLHGKYLVGRALGAGGFGVTYIGFDLYLEIRVAIKEFYPGDYVSREQEKMVVPFPGRAQKFFLEEKERFIEEARILAQFDKEPGIVSVKDYFEENGTAYIVMEYLEGRTLAQIMRESGGKLESEKVFQLMRPVIRSMAEIHDKGIIHKDISPDNIMILEDNRVKLIDFGAAAKTSTADGQELWVYKQGYSPVEQKTGTGQLGSWTDIYAFAATMYHAISGHLPDDCVKRSTEDQLPDLLSYHVNLTALQNAAIMNGLAVRAEDRIQNARDLYYFLYVYGQQDADSATPDKMKILVRERSTKAMMQHIEKVSISQRRKKTFLIIAIAVIATDLIFVAAERFRKAANEAAETENGTTETSIVSVKQQEVQPEQQVSELVSLLNRYCEDNNYDTYHINADLTDMASAYAEKCHKTGIVKTAQDWTTRFNQYADEVKNDANQSDVSWVVIPEDENVSAQKIMDEIDSNESYKKVLLSGNELGVDVTQNSQGYVFWIFFVK